MMMANMPRVWLVCQVRRMSAKENKPIPHLQPIPPGLITSSTMNPDIQGVIRNGKKLIPIAKALDLMLVISAIMISFRILAPVMPKFAKMNPPAYTPKLLELAQRMYPSR